MSDELADGRVLDLDVSGGARVEELAAQIGSALAETGTEAASGAGEQADPSAASQQVRLVRLVGLDLEADPLGTVRRLADELRSRGLIAPAPAAASDGSGAASASASASGRTLRDLLGLPETPFHLDPARRADRARLTSEENA
ncbi:hypothetical protein [Brachybacterium sp. GPGPB12]|uniref:hypothetical protein n=1 Tax=Brachybacterium sp. GPGPB12 TaxID=3023517 RepID=UPI003134461E